LNKPTDDVAHHVSEIFNAYLNAAAAAAEKNYDELVFKSRQLRDVTGD